METKLILAVLYGIKNMMILYITMIRLLGIIMDIRIKLIYMSALHLKRTQLFINSQLENLKMELILTD